jgi:hypothetical protein
LMFCDPIGLDHLYKRNTGHQNQNQQFKFYYFDNKGDNSICIRDLIGGEMCA